MTEGERIIRLETQMQNIENKVDDVKEMLERFIDHADQKYSAKWVEKAIWGVCSVVGLAIVGATLSLILK